MIKIKHQEDGKRGTFTLLENQIPAGEMTYVWAGKNKFIIDHTETFENFSGKGYGKQLVLKGIAYAEEQGVKIIPLCPYAKKVMENNQDLHQWIFR
mgnify:CR=1 FL=1|tara:strand:+ start:2637 stop:2924 length:288 start_codon:yes stop_codon:yes gene_type:complete